MPTWDLAVHSQSSAGSRAEQQAPLVPAKASAAAARWLTAVHTKTTQPQACVSGCECEHAHMDVCESNKRQSKQPLPPQKKNNLRTVRGRLVQSMPWLTCLLRGCGPLEDLRVVSVCSRPVRRRSFRSHSSHSCGVSQKMWNVRPGSCTSNRAFCKVWVCVGMGKHRKR